MPQKMLFSSKLDQSYSSDSGELDNDLGRMRYENDGRIFRFVRNDDTATLALGQACCHTLNDGVTHQQGVKVPLTANLGALAGIVMATAGIATTKYGWIQIFGANASVSVSGTTTGGTAIANGDFLKAADSVAHLVRDAAVTRVYKNVVQILTAVGTTTTPAAALKPGFIQCI